MPNPILSGAQVRRTREELGLTQEELATKLGFHGPLRRQRISKIETGLAEIDYPRANLLMAMQGGYQPFGYAAVQRTALTHRQLEALWVAKHTGSALNLASKRKGGPRRIFYALRDMGYLNGDFSITPDGSKALEEREGKLRKPLAPLHQGKLLAKLGRRR